MLEGSIQDKARQRDILQFMETWRGLTESDKDSASQKFYGSYSESGACNAIRLTLDSLASEPHKFNVALQQQLDAEATQCTTSV